MHTLTKKMLAFFEKKWNVFVGACSRRFVRCRQTNDKRRTTGKPLSAKRANSGTKRARAAEDDKDATADDAGDAAHEPASRRAKRPGAVQRVSLRDRRRLCESVPYLSADDSAQLVAIIARRMPDLQPDIVGDRNACFVFASALVGGN